MQNQGGAGFRLSGDLIVDLVPDIIAVVDNGKKYTWLNKAGLEFFGPKVIGREAADFFAGAQETYRQVDPIFAGKAGIFYVESWQKRQDGEVRLLAWWCRTLEENRGAISVARDITDSFNLQQRLSLSQTQLDNAMRLAHLGPWEYDVVKDTFTFNDAFYAVFGTTADKEGGYEMTSREYAERFVHPEDAPLVGREVEKSIQTTDPNFTQQLEHRIKYADGRIGYISVRFFILKDKDGRTIKTFGINQDITENKQREENLKKMRDDLQLKVDELERFNKLVVDRELKMVELKECIQKLEERIRDIDAGSGRK